MLSVVAAMGILVAPVGMAAYVGKTGAVSGGMGVDTLVIAVHGAAFPVVFFGWQYGGDTHAYIIGASLRRRSSQAKVTPIRGGRTQGQSSTGEASKPGSQLVLMLNFFERIIEKAHTFTMR